MCCVTSGEADVGIQLHQFLQQVSIDLLHDLFPLAFILLLTPELIPENIDHRIITDLITTYLKN